MIVNFSRFFFDGKHRYKAGEREYYGDPKQLPKDAVVVSDNAERSDDSGAPAYDSQEDYEAAVDDPETQVGDTEVSAEQKLLDAENEAAELKEAARKRREALAAEQGTAKRGRGRPFGSTKKAE